jgi:hypothetical protein
MLQVESLGSLGMEFRFAETIMLQKESYGLHRGNHALLVWWKWTTRRDSNFNVLPWHTLAIRCSKCDMMLPRHRQT